MNAKFGVIFVSLVSLTFGERRNNFTNTGIAIQVIRPADCIKIDPNAENKIEVVKSCIFFQKTEPYIVGNVVSGAICEQMRGTVNGKEFEIIELDSKYGAAGKAKKGMTVGLTVKGLEREEIQKGTVIEFKVPQPCQ